MDKHKAKQLLEKYSKGRCTEEEKAWVETYYNLHHHAGSGLSDKELLKELNSIERSLPGHKRKVLSWPMVAAAAAMLLLVLAGWWMYLSPRNIPGKNTPVVAAKEAIGPGGPKAILTLANGKKISLTDAGNGKLAHEAGINITKTADGQMVYQIMEPSATGTALAFNTIETPVGGQYQVQLPDGTRIWLNSKSYLRFPLRFSAKERRVEMTGEAYFEVTHDKTKPFRVVSDQQTLEVLGTHFNVNAYADEESIKTTLLEGAVKIDASVLKPGQQAVFTHDSRPDSYRVTIHDNVIVDDIIAWKNNKIQFTDLDIHSIMRMLARWYNIDVQFDGGPITTNFGGSVSRSKNIDVLLKLLEATGDVHFKIEGRRVTVMP